MTVDVDRCHSIEIRTAVGHGRIVVERGRDKRGIDLTQQGCVGTAIDIVSGKIAGGWSCPVQVDDMVRGWLNDDLIRHAGNMVVTAGHGDGERISCGCGGSSREIKRVSRWLHGHTGGKFARSNSPR